MKAKDIKHIIKQRAITQEKFAQMVGVSQQVVNGWFSRDKIKSDYWDTINDVLGLQEQTVEPKGDFLEIRTISAEAGASNCMEVDCLDNMESGGTILIHKDGIQFSDQSNLVAIPVSGTSMLPTIMPNEYVIIDTYINNYIGDDLYVLNFAGNMLVKRLQFDPTTHAIDIISDNPQYKSYKLNLNEDQSHFHIIGKVVTTIRR